MFESKCPRCQQKAYINNMWCTACGYSEDSDEFKMKEALDILKKYSKLHNDLNAYLYTVIEWATKDKKKPNPEDYGLSK